MTIHPQFAIGTMVTYEERGTRGDEGEMRTIPAVVMHQWSDGSLRLYCFHFEGSFLKNSVPCEMVKIVAAAGPEMTRSATALKEKYSFRDV